MAGDLIPPPSPAGRPTPEGSDGGEPHDEHGPGDLRLQEAPPDPTAAEESAAPVEPLPESPYRSRFGFVLGALIGVGLAAAAVAAVILVGGGSSRDNADWSPWRPHAKDGFGAAREIADHVGKRYRMADGSQIVAITAGPLELQDRLPLSVVVRTAPQGGDIELVEGKGVLYTLNGLGPEGSIAKGKPSEERLLLLRREALELALYTFRYVDDVDMVVALLPPGPPQKVESTDPPAAAQAPGQTEEVRRPLSAMLFRPGDLRTQLDVPLASTLAPRAPRPETLREPEAGLIKNLTRPNFFRATFQPSQDARVFLVLDRPPS